MKPWRGMTNEELVLHLELWLDLDGRVQSSNQVEFFQEVCWRLMMTSFEGKEA